LATYDIAVILGYGISKISDGFKCKRITVLQISEVVSPSVISVQRTKREAHSTGGT
jgi:hypothetical protein